ncbi:hypothetical protein HQ496_05260 [bacterium]|nr:hypothetical protein [bacterium]
MSHYEQRLEHDLNSIRFGIAELGLTVHTGLSNSIEALLTQNADLAYSTILGDHPVNRNVDALNQECHRFIAKHLPSAGHLRFISSSLRTIILMERLGDYAATISKESVHLDIDLQGSFKNDLQTMAYNALEMLADAVNSYKEQDAVLAQKTTDVAKKVDREFVMAYSDLVELDASELERKDLFARLNIINLIERVSDQAKNLCEEVVFTKTGKTKQRRPFRLLFLDEKDDGATQIAVSLCRKFYANRVTANSAGLHPSASLRSDVHEMCTTKGLDISGLDPSKMNTSDNTWKTNDVFICIDVKTSDFMAKVPYGCSVVNWKTPDAADTATLFAFISEHVESLVQLVRGPATQSTS